MRRALACACAVALALATAVMVAGAAAKPRSDRPAAKCAAQPRSPRPAHARSPRRAHARSSPRPIRCARLRAGRLVGAARRAGAGLAPAAPAPTAAVGAPAAPAPAPVAPPTPTPDGPALPPVYSNPFAVQVQATEFALQLSKSTVSAGDVRVEFNLSRAQDPHNLMLVRADGTGPLYSFDEQPSGAVVSRTLPLTAGRWRLFCSLTGHDAAGMHATLTVG